MRIRVRQTRGLADGTLRPRADPPQLRTLIGGRATPIALRAVEHGPRQAAGADRAGPAPPGLGLGGAGLGLGGGDEVEVGAGAGRIALPGDVVCGEELDDAHDRPAVQGQGVPSSTDHTMTPSCRHCRTRPSFCSLRSARWTRSVVRPVAWAICPRERAPWVRRVWMRLSR